MKENIKEKTLDLSTITYKICSANFGGKKTNHVDINICTCLYAVNECIFEKNYNIL